MKKSPQNDPADESTLDITEGPVETPAAEAGADEKYQALYDQFVRLQADFENFRRRTESERESLIKFGVEQSVTRLLSVFDNLERGIGTLNENSDPQTLYKSFSLMHKELLDAFAAVGLSRIKTVGEEFDPNFHEAVGYIESAGHAENTVAAELRAGFMLQDKILRPALVQVSSGAGAEANPFQEPAAEQNV